MRDGVVSLAGGSLAGTMREGLGTGTAGDRLADGVSRKDLPGIVDRVWRNLPEVARTAITDVAGLSLEVYGFEDSRSNSSMNSRSHGM